MMLTVACVRTGQKYGVEYVHRLRAGVARHLPVPHCFVCLTDRPQDLPDYDCLPVDGLTGWWAKLKLFDPSWRQLGRAVYFDLDTVVVGDLAGMTYHDESFAICENFTRAAGHKEWPCRYGSAVMTFRPGWGEYVWQAFIADRDAFMVKAGNYGDQKIIEELVPHAIFLQDLMEPGFFLGYRDLPKHERPPKGCSVVVFAGSHKPHNTNCAWARAAWAA